MHQVTVDEPTRGKLAGLSEAALIRDESGKLLGVFRPTAEASLYRGVEPPISEEELDRREREGIKFSTAEVLAHLDRLGSA